MLIVETIFFSVLFFIGFVFSPIWLYKIYNDIAY